MVKFDPSTRRFSLISSAVSTVAKYIPRVKSVGTKAGSIMWNKAKGLIKSNSINSAVNTVNKASTHSTDNLNS